MPATFRVLVQLLGTSLAPGPVESGRSKKEAAKGLRARVKGEGQSLGSGGTSSGRLQGVRLPLLKCMVLVQETEGKEIPDTGNMSQAMGNRSVSSTVHSAQWCVRRVCGSKGPVMPVPHGPTK